MAIVEEVDGVGGRRRLRLTSPVDGAELRLLEVANAEDVRAAVDRAREVQVAWGALPPAERGRQVARALGVLLQRREHFIDRIVAETGRSRLETLIMEMFPACDSVQFYSRRAAKMLAEQRVGLHLLRAKRARLRFHPLGVVGIITPWNGPFILALNPTVQAVLAGNAVVLKPSEVTPDSSGLVAELFREAKLPENLVQVVQGDGETGAALLESGVDKISFTGSVATGRKVGETCGRNLVPCTLELGGKDPMIVCEDADLERAAGGALFGGLMNNGQFCSSTERIYVFRSVVDRFTDLLVEKARGLSQARQGCFDVGPFIERRQIETVERHLRDAVDRGARVLVGGQRNLEVGSHYFQPTVLTDVTHEMAIMREETFGPVLPVLPVDSEAEAIALANDTPFGLGATIWTRNRARALRMSAQVYSGSVCINESSLTYGALELPFGGRRESGVGQVNGRDALRRYSYAQPVIEDRFGLKSEMVWYPFSQDKYEKLSKAMDIIWGTPLRWFLG